MDLATMIAAQRLATHQMRYDPEAATRATAEAANRAARRNRVLSSIVRASAAITSSAFWGRIWRNP